MGADEDGSWRQDRVTPVADREQQRPQLQQQQAAHGGPGTLIAALWISPRHDFMHTCLASWPSETWEMQQEPARTDHIILHDGCRQDKRHQI